MELIEEKLILKNLVINEEYFAKVFPFLEENLFTEKYTKKIFSCIKDYNLKYNRKPTLPVIDVFVERVTGITESDHRSMIETIEFFHKEEEYNFDWLCDKTIEFVQNRKYYEAIGDAAIKYEKGILDPELSEKLNQALSITFDSEIGMGFEDASKRYDIYTIQEDRIPFLVNKFNEVTKGGVTRKTLNCLMSSNTGGFKSGTMCSMACDYIRQGYNVLYLTFEMAENKIMERIDANMLNVNIDDLTTFSKEIFVSKIDDIISRTQGRLKVKQFPTSQCHVGMIRYLLKELKLKENFIPDVIMFDYLGIMSSIRYNQNTQEHVVLKAVCEEVRGLCVEYNVIGWTAMQSNRGGANAGIEMSIGDISSSYGTTFGFDMLWGLITTEDFDKQHKILVKQLKNRYSDIMIMPSFFIGVNKSRMKVFDILDTMNQEYKFENKDDLIKQNNDAEMNSFSLRCNTKHIDSSMFNFD